MYVNTKALQAGANGILLGWYFLAGALHFYHFVSIMAQVAPWINFGAAGICLAWIFSRDKPYVAYGGLHTFFALCCLGLAFFTTNTEAGVAVLFLPLGISLLLFLFMQPILALLPRRSEEVTLKETREEPLPYTVGYRRPSPTGVVYEEGEQSLPDSHYDSEQPQTRYPRMYQ